MVNVILQVYYTEAEVLHQLSIYSTSTTTAYSMVRLLVYVYVGDVVVTSESTGAVYVPQLTAEINITNVIEILQMLLRYYKCYRNITNVFDILQMLLKYYKCYWNITNVIGIYKMLLKYYKCYWNITNVIGKLQMLLENGFVVPNMLFLQILFIF